MRIVFKRYMWKSETPPRFIDGLPAEFKTMKHRVGKSLARSREVTLYGMHSNFVESNDLRVVDPQTEIILNAYDTKIEELTEELSRAQFMRRCTIYNNFKDFRKLTKAEILELGKKDGE